MPKTWVTFEDRVRGLAQYIWGRPCQPKRIGGVNIDGVVQLDADISYFIEMTEERTLGKVREDVVKLQTAKAAAFAQGTLARCFCIVDGTLTEGMVQAGEPTHTRVLSINEFSKMFFDFAPYRNARELSPFGSAVNPLTGEQDKTEYVRVRYLVEGQKHEVLTADIGEWLRKGKRVILLGEYGSGKSRCLQEVFRYLSHRAEKEFCYPIAIDLRNAWGLIRGNELIARHFTDLGLDQLQGNAIRALNAGAFAVLLDGFDEIGSQAWSNDGEKLKVIRAKALEGVKDLIQRSKGGVLITGREHYFPSNAEMFAALGLKPGDTIVLRSKNEFSDTELMEYFRFRDIDVDIPGWLPRRPLICQTISDLADAEFERMFSEESGEVAFWDHFIRVLCERDARIHVSFDPDTIFRLFVHLARLTRNKAANVGPISLTELQDAFEAAVGQRPVEQASIMLQRLPSLGRISTESSDRQFIDVYILDGLRAKDVVNLFASDEETISHTCASVWINSLDDLGQRILAHDPRVAPKSLLQLAQRCLASENKTLACDVVASLLREGDVPFNFEGMAVDQGTFLYFDMTGRKVENLNIANSYFGSIVLPSPGAKNVQIIDCMTPRVYGVTAASALPGWIRKLDAEEFDSVQSVSRIRRIGLSPGHEILITIIRKTFFQKGGGRREEALVRGLGKIAAPGLTNKILNLLMREGVLERFKGDSGWVYSPVRSQAGRMQKLLDELRGSNDSLWKDVENL